MSITIGKRGFTSISEHEKILHNQGDFRRCKGGLIINESGDSSNSNKQRNLAKLEEIFPNKSKNELIQLMEDFDYDMDLLIEVLKKRNEENLQLKNNANNNNSNPLAREIRSFKSLKLKNNSELKPSFSNNNEMLCEESNKKNPKNDIKNENLIKSIAQELINKLSTSPNLDQAFSDVLTAFKFYEESLTQSNLEADKKINQENSLLKKAFYKQFKKTEDLEKNYQKLLVELEKNKDELKKAQNTIYSLSLIVRSLDTNQTNSYNHEIF